MRSWGVAVATAALALSLGAPAGLRSATGADAPRPFEETHPVAFFDSRTFAEARRRAEREPVVARHGVRGIVVPHHWLAGELIVGAMRDTAAAMEVRRVVLVGPNHIGAGGAAFITSRQPWQTPYGFVRPDDSVERLARSGVAKANPAVLGGEHSIAGLIPAIAWYYPDATVVPIAVRRAPDPVELHGAVEAIAELARDPGTLVIASVDFSHYRSVLEARRRDLESIAALSSMDAGSVFGFGNEHMDSPASIVLLMEAMRAIDATRFEVWHNRTSADFGGGSAAPGVTSYVVGGYR